MLVKRAAGFTVPLHYNNLRKVASGVPASGIPASGKPRRILAAIERSSEPCFNTPAVRSGPLEPAPFGPWHPAHKAVNDCGAVAILCAAAKLSRFIMAVIASSDALRIVVPMVTSTRSYCYPPRSQDVPCLRTPGTSN